MGLTVGHATLAAAARLLGSFLARVVGIDLVEILAAVIGGPLGGHIPIHRHKLEHLLSCHLQASAFLGAPEYDGPAKMKSQLY